MTYQIDQSGRIEQTNLNTILAITDKKNKQMAIIFDRKIKEHYNLYSAIKENPHVYYSYFFRFNRYFNQKVSYWPQ